MTQKTGVRPRRMARRPSLFAANALYLLAAAGLVCTSWAIGPFAALLRRAFPGLSTEGLMLVATLLYYLTCTALPCLLYARRRRVWRALRLEQPLSPVSAIYAAMAAVVSLPLGSNIALFWSLLLNKLGLDAGGAAMYVPADTSGLLLAVFYVAVIPGVCEELAFRGLVFSAWERRGSRRAVWISALLFASLHGSIAGFPTQLLLGVALGLLALGSGSLYAGMIFHTVYNSLILMSEYTVQNLTGAADEAAYAAALAEYASPSGLFHACLDALLLGAVLAFLLRRVWTRGSRTGVPRFTRDRGGMTAAELLLLISGVVTALYLYGEDLLEMLGVLA